MKKKLCSIRVQFSLIFFALLAAVVIMCVLINTFFLSRYYLNNKKATIETAYYTIDELLDSEDTDTDTDSFNTVFEQICNTNNLDIVIIDPSLETVKSSIRDEDKVSQRLFSFIFKDDPNYLFRKKHEDETDSEEDSGPADYFEGETRDTEEEDYFADDEDGIFDDEDDEDVQSDDKAVDESQENGSSKKTPPDLSNEDFGFKNEHIAETNKYVISITTDPRMQLEYMELMGSLSNGDMIIIRSAVRGITEGANLSTRFLVYIGFLALIIGAVVVWLVTNRVTRPILHLAELSDRMTHLDFSAKYTGRDQNEIGFLGHHMNVLSSTLEDTISELKTANNKLRMDLENRERLDEMRSDFISNVSHELKTPIAIIQGYAEGLKDAVNDDPESRDYYCDVIMDEAAKMNRMVKNLLALNQLEFGGESLNIERFDIVLLIKNYIQSAGILLEQADATAEVIAPDELFVWADEYRIEEVFMNYFSNAVHHISGDRKITVTITELENVARISVFNTGEPIPEESLSLIWTKFYKVDKARSREYGGSGVGLSIVKAIMDMHGREYGVINHDDGVEFYFEVDTNSEQ